MKWYLNLSTSKKLLLNYGAITLLIFLVCGISYHEIDSISQSQQMIYKHDFALVKNLIGLSDNLSKQRANTLKLITEKDNNGKELARQAIITQKVVIDQYIDKLDVLVEGDSEAKENLQKIKSILGEYRKTRDEQVLAFVQSNNPEKAVEIVSGVQSDRLMLIREINQKLINQADKHVEEMIALSTDNETFAKKMFVTIGICGLLLVVILTIMMQKLIGKPLNEVSKVAERFGAGDLTVSVPVRDSQDEVGILTRVFDEMIRNNVILIREFIDGINLITTSANQIVTSTMQLSSSVNETATAVSETTTTIEEVKQASQISSQKSKLVSENAQHAASISQEGEKVTQESNGGMKQILDQMSSIAESMMHLSEQTQSITSIIATVDDLSQQSNLLAVNASIEAEKAGEQGRGFRVVAQEIKSLADQSKQATKRIREILSEVQKATSKAVLSTEQGNKVVESGSDKVEKSGSLISTLAKNSIDAAQAADQIATSSHQQLIGMEQVATAMENIKQASMLNVESARQLELSGHDLTDLGSRLKNLVGRYKLS